MGGTKEAHKEARGIHPNSSSNVAFNATVPVVHCTGFVSHTDPVRGSLSGSWLAHLPHPKPLLSCFISYCQTYIFKIVYHLSQLARVTSREQGQCCFCNVVSNRIVPQTPSVSICQVNVEKHQCLWGSLGPGIRNGWMFSVNVELVPVAQAFNTICLGD